QAQAALRRGAAADGGYRIRAEELHVGARLPAALHGSRAHDAGELVARRAHRAQPRQYGRRAALRAATEDRVPEREPDERARRIGTEPRMSEELSAAAAAPEADRTPGALLKRERERRSISVQQAAEDLHLDPWIIEAIEANRFQALGAPVYAKGHLRKYATKLGLSVQEVFDRYEALNDRPVEPDPIPTAIATPPVQPRRASKAPIWIILGIVVVALAGWGVYAWLSSGRIWPLSSAAVPAQSASEQSSAEAS